MTDQRDTYPLRWPTGWPRAKNRRAAPYKVTLEQAVKEAVAELSRMGAKDVVLSSNMRVGLIRSSETELKDPGVALYWTTKGGQPMVMACDGWSRLRDNVRAIGLTLAAIRAIERSGASQLLERVFTGFQALPEGIDHWKVLGIEQGASEERLSARYRELARKLHPDHGGTDAQMAKVNQAYSDALREVRAS